MNIISSQLVAENASFHHVIPAGEPYLFEVKAGQTFRLLDSEGNQAVLCGIIKGKSKARVYAV